MHALESGAKRSLSGLYLFLKLRGFPRNEEKRINPFGLEQSVNPNQNGLVGGMVERSGTIP